MVRTVRHEPQHLHFLDLSWEAPRLLVSIYAVQWRSWGSACELWLSRRPIIRVKPSKWWCPKAGGSSDLVTRALAVELAAALKQNVLARACLVLESR
jgi:hypothetical protein